MTELMSLEYELAFASESEYAPHYPQVAVKPCYQKSNI
jgi:hypothetical protein